MRRGLSVVLAVAVLGAGIGVESASAALAFGPAGVLFVGDSRAGAVFALDLGDKADREVAKPSAVEDVEGKLAALLWVEDASGRAREGTAAVSARETRWSFRPERGWPPGRYALRVHPALEDRAGNRFDRVFDRESGSGAAGDVVEEEPLRLEFTVENAR